MAVILSGGQSRRMGQDKGLIQEHGTSWVKRLQSKLAYLEIPVYVSVNPEQKKAYQKHLSSAQLITDEPFENLNGPLKGILSSHLAFPGHHMLFLPCDMALLDAQVFDLWLDCFNQHYPKYHVFVSKTPDGLQPLCGIYSRRGLQQLEELYQQGSLKDQSMHGIVEEKLKSHIMEIPNRLISLFKNYNTPEDLE